MDGFSMNIEYLNNLKEKSGLTNEQLSQVSGIPESTITRIFNGRTDNPYFQTIVDIVRSLNGSVDVMENLPSEHMSSDTTETSAGTASEAKTEPDHKLIALYREIISNKEHWLRFLVAILLVIVFLIFTMVAYDILHPFEGWIQY